MQVTVTIELCIEDLKAAQKLKEMRYTNGEDIGYILKQCLWEQYTRHCTHKNDKRIDSNE